MKKLIIFFPIALILLTAMAMAAEPDRILINSQDWKDVYSVMQYGVLVNKNSNFLVSEKHANIILGQIPQTEHLWVFSSTKTPFVLGYETILKGQGYSAEEFKPASINLDLAKRSGVKNFVVVDGKYGYNAISVAPYAAVSKSFVLFADKNNINQIIEFLAQNIPQKILIYGQVDREVKTALTTYNPEIINKEGDRFANNIEIVKKYQEIKSAKQAVLTNGEFIEKEIMSGVEPVIFIGTSNVPQIIRDYIKGSDIQVGILIGNELVGTATFIRRQIGISVFVKFAQGARQPQGAISQVEALDMFYLPTYNIEIEFVSMKYNAATKKLEVTVRNTQDLAAYFSGTYTITGQEDNRITVGDSTPVFLDGREVKTLVYTVDNIPDGDISGRAYIVYGESINSMEKIIDKDTGLIEQVRIIDNCDITIDAASFNLGRNLFYIDITNKGSTTCYVNVELVNVIIAQEKKTMGSEGVTKLEPGEQKQVKIKANPLLIDEDIADNPEINVRAFYGERQDSLTKSIEGKFALTMAKGDYVFYTLIVIIVVLFLLILWKRRKKKKKDKIVVKDKDDEEE